MAWRAFQSSWSSFSRSSVASGRVEWQQDEWLAAARLRLGQKNKLIVDYLQGCPPKSHLLSNALNGLSQLTCECRLTAMYLGMKTEQPRKRGFDVCSFRSGFSKFWFAEHFCHTCRKYNFLPPLKTKFQTGVLIFENKKERWFLKAWVFWVCLELWGDRSDCPVCALFAFMSIFRMSLKGSIRVGRRSLGCVCWSHLCDVSRSYFLIPKGIIFFKKKWPCAIFLCWQ